MIEGDPTNLPPRGTGSAVCLEEVPRPSPATQRAYGVLVVDDEGCVRDVLRIGMRQRGFAVWLACGGQQALDLYRRDRESIDVVLLDVHMPGTDGPRTLAALRALNPLIRCCFMSGDLGSYTEGGLCNLGAAAVIRKPFRLADGVQPLWRLV